MIKWMCIALKYGVWNAAVPKGYAVNTLVSGGYAPLVAMILAARGISTKEQADSYRVDPKMEEILRYIGRHLEEPLSVEMLAGTFYISRYYLMHRFKAVTGYTVHQYISQKRLLLAGELIRTGVPVMKAAEQAGFSEYSTFLRAFQNTFHMSPREFR